MAVSAKAHSIGLPLTFIPTGIVFAPKPISRRPSPLSSGSITGSAAVFSLLRGSTCLAVDPTHLMPISSAQRRITRLATLTAVHRAFHWLHLHQPQLRQWQLELVRIPAPPFGEQARANWFLDRFHQLGLTNIHTDDEGNALGELAPDSSLLPIPSSLLPLPSSPHPLPVVLLSAHLDTVFPAGTPSNPSKKRTAPASTPPASATTSPASPACSPSPPRSATPTSLHPSPSSSPPT